MCFHLTADVFVVEYLAFMLSVARLIGCTPKMPWDPAQIVKIGLFLSGHAFFEHKDQGPILELVKKFFLSLVPMMLWHLRRFFLFFLRSVS